MAFALRSGLGSAGPAETSTLPQEVTMVRRLMAITSSLLIAFVAASGTANAAPTTTTTHEHGVVETFIDVSYV